MKILQTATFKKQIKKLNKNQILAINEAIKAIAQNPTIGERKKGSLKEVYVHKFHTLDQLILLAYKIRASELILLAIGAHENFYRDLKTIM